jgi:hypothetical protein
MADFYYYANGELIQLTPETELLAVDEQHLTEAALPEAVREEVRKAAKPLRAGIQLVRLGALSPQVEAILKESKALQPVFRAEGALLVVLPEVRVEETRPKERARLVKWIESHTEQLSVHSERDGRFVLAPASGHGEDALNMARQLNEEVEPELAQPRFVRVVQHPSMLR